ncbi:hypothetical protein B0H14DRAFT_2580423 [Mycena olivaceomarginata]|nr:hypothetical protein B0H14DRAFT_2642301 [Mycena olivaceomarginata]KAJ7732497.1 hypothetical protein B0H14DRAFT_2639827 [Mycena olivaceomarginata]KAJ7813400.1 hypothetical protein B0H14DRAFT_2605026 [Mycena olivaceomarginata]KAJ7853578.1 hypothetical protein B0H14DRAFT_2580423 [Mycena olivaceomarginata]
MAQSQTSKVLCSPKGMSSNLRNTLNLNAISVLPQNVELGYKIEIAHKVLQTTQHEAQLIRLLLEAADHEITSCDKEIKIKELEVKLAESRKEEASLRHNYYTHMHEVVGDKVCNAEMQAAVLRLEGREAGILEPGISGSGLSLRVQGRVVEERRREGESSDVRYVSPTQTRAGLGVEYTGKYLSAVLPAALD